ncbi:MAG: hypothetical protein R3F37_16215 [Candidatus Competibacteraceae bacterium]
MKVDPIVEEIRQGRMEHAKKFNFDLAKIAEDYRKIEERYKRAHHLRQTKTISRINRIVGRISPRNPPHRPIP